MPVTTTTSQSRATGAGGMYSDPQTVGDLIKKQYPGYYDQMDSVQLGQGWIANHTPAPSTGTGAGADILQAPGSAALTSTDPNQSAPDLSGLSKFASVVKPPAPQIIISGLSGNNPMGTGNMLMSTPIQYQQPQPQKPLPSSTFDITKAGF